MEEKDWNLLLHTINRGNCVVFLGPEMAQDVVDGHSRALTEVLARRLADELKQRSPTDILIEYDLAHVARKYSDYNSSIDLQVAVTQFYEEKKDHTSQPYLDLAALPFHLVVKTTPDAYFLEALRRHKKPCQVEGYHYRGPRRDLVPPATAKKPMVYYLYGYVDVPESLVISENDVLDFLVNVIAKNPPLPTNISSEIRDPSKCFLFLGFSFKNWYLRILFHVLQGQSHSNRSFALEATGPENDPAHQGAILFFKDTHKIYHYCLDVGVFTDELRRRYETKYGVNHIPASTGAEAQVLVEAPMAFICHASEDAGYAAELSRKLREAGIDTWLDKAALKTGDDWNRQIEDAIGDVDFFLILQSRAMRDKNIAYVNKEINLALERRREFRPGIRFIMPLIIEEGGEMEDFDDLSTFQALDLAHDLAHDKEQSLTQLVNAIERDFERRKRK